MHMVSSHVDHTYFTTNKFTKSKLLSREMLIKHCTTVCSQSESSVRSDKYLDYIKLFLLFVGTRSRRLICNAQGELSLYVLGVLVSLVLFSAVSICRLQTGGMGLLVACEDYGFIFKMKMTEVSNPMRRKQKRPGLGSNSFDLKNIANTR